MPTKKIERLGAAGRWLRRNEAIGWLNITEREWVQYFEQNENRHMRPKLYIGGVYDKEELDRLMLKHIQIDNK